VWGRPEVARDVIYIDDFAEAVRLMLDHDTLRSDVFNIGSGVATTVGQVVSWILGHAGHEPEEIVYHEHKPMTLAFRCLDCSKAGRLLGWKPQHTVEVGIRKTLQWWKANMKWWRI
jgi:nucleoside-diphosphate-sugar epimerase